ncbi:hypothetical protein HPB50_017765 [Hyalomma asiaticum]|uniref:Uncharacterized protein n=1 Tax=Hyalomma asiaticum TaxID=266040 RepID=A0ACB7TI56_HYAAI|nr:hypothetical protein HPB50_017765 [Hyalomma asiaticum]
MAMGSWLDGGTESTVLHVYLDPPGCASTSTVAATGSSSHSNGSHKGCPLDSVDEVRRRKITRVVGIVRALRGSLSNACACIAASMQSYFGQPSSSPASSTVAAEHRRQRWQSSSHCHRRQQSQQQHQQKRRDGGVGAKVPTCVDCRIGRERRSSTWMPAVCAGIVAALCYINSLDGDFVHDDMVAVVGNADVTGDSRRHASSSSSLWANDFWGRPMSDPRSHKSYRPLTVLTFRANYYANGRQVRGFHMVNVALHCACSVLVAIVARSVLRVPDLYACLGAAMFAAHPVHTEAVSIHHV